MTAAEKASLLEADAATAAQSGKASWKPFTKACADYRRKGWTYPQIWKRMAELGLVSLDDRQAFLSFRCSMITHLKPKA